MNDHYRTCRHSDIVRQGNGNQRHDLWKQLTIRELNSKIIYFGILL